MNRLIHYILHPLLLLPVVAVAQEPVACDTTLVMGNPAVKPVIVEYVNHISADAPFKSTQNGIIVIGSGRQVRAVGAVSLGNSACHAYAEMANRYKRTFGNKVNVYCTAIPTACEFYTPDKANRLIRSQRPVMQSMFNHLSDSVYAVDIYTPLASHVSEDIYLRTDHHWAPRGAYYAARAFAEVAGVPFRDLDSYDQHVIHRYVGTMSTYSKDPAVRQAPEDFVYWTPRDLHYETTYITYTLDSSHKKIVGTSKPTRGNYFQSYKDGSSAAYCTFMGGDSKITQVRTDTHNHRRVLILKDSFGNAIPGYLFFSFEEIHVIDCRFFNRNIRKYVEENSITDILFANNVSHASLSTVVNAYGRFLNQSTE